MNFFIKRSIIFASGFLIFIIVGLILPNNNSQRSVDYSLLAKHDLLESTKGPKLILTGGSNVLFGFNSEIISNELKMPVVNHGIHAGYGLKYILDDVLPFVKKNDIVVLSPEYSFFIDKNYLGKEPLLFSLTAKPENLKHISFSQLSQISQFIPKFSFNRTKSFIFNAIFNSKNNSESTISNYTEFAINKYGDHNLHWDNNKLNFDSYDFNGAINNDVLLFINKISKEIKSKGARLLIAYPSLCKSSFELNSNTVENIELELKKYNFNIIGTPKNYCFEDYYFFDSPYHLNGQGVIKRTNQLLIELKEVLK